MNSLRFTKKFFSSNIQALNNFKQDIFSSISSIKYVNIQDYYQRRYEYDFNRNKFEQYSEEQLKKELEEFNKVVTVQNLYFMGNTIVCDGNVEAVPKI